MRKYLTRLLVASLALFAIFMLALTSASYSPTSAAPNATLSAAPALKVEQAVLNDTANGKLGAFVVLLADQADVSAAYNMKDKDARGWYVYNTLKNKADQTQGSIIALLTSQGLNYQSFWVANAIVVYNGSRATVDQLAARSDVQAIESNDSFRAIEPPQIANLQPAPQSPNTVEWGVHDVNADAVWSMGYTGTNIVIGNADTGMQWDHPALKPHYRGWNGSTADHNYNWHDSIHDSTGNPCGNNSQFPCDDYGHGTHTTGTTSGDDGSGNQIGVAPGAKWIGCRNMDQGNGTPARYTECFQWFIAPTDLNNQNPNPALRPDVINNSWDCPNSEGCGQLTLLTIVNNTRAAGIFVEASAQNAGPACSTVENPPAIYDAAFATGAYDSSHDLADFSSRGPATTTGHLKPQISAPGVNVRSSIPGNNYGVESGTSMAGPHVVGSVALLWSARPQLERDITTTEQILENTANPNVIVPGGPQTCGGIPSSQIPNNSFGYGRVDVLAAVNSVPLQTPTPTVTGTPPTATPTNTVAPTNTPTPTVPTNTPTVVPPTATPAPPTTTPTQTPCPAYWFNDSNIPGPRIGAASAGGNNAIFEAGGDDGSPSHISNTAAMYTGSGTWQAIPNMPISTTDASGLSDGTNFYVVGGKDANGLPTSNVQIYNSISNTWTMGAPVPTPVYGATGAYYFGIYLFGGCTDAACSAPASINQIYNTVNNSWAPGADVPSGLAYGYASLVGSKSIYVVGGLDSTGAATNRVQIYDFADNRWHSIGLAQLQNTWSKMAGGIFNGDLYIFGGVTNGITNRTISYNQLANTWIERAPLNLATSDMQGAALHGNLYIIGGSTGGSNATSRVERYSPSCSGTPTPVATATPGGPTNTPTPTSTMGPPSPTAAASPTTAPPSPTPCLTAGGWSAIASMPTTAIRNAGVYYPPNGKFYSLGGRTADGSGNDILHPYEYDPTANTWITRSASFDNPFVDNMVAAALTDTTGTHIYTVGGSQGGTFSTTAEVRVYDPIANTISVLTSDPWTQTVISPNILPGGFAVINNTLYILGGIALNANPTQQYTIRDIWQFDPNRAPGSRWIHKMSRLPVAEGYVPAAGLGSDIYTGGGAVITGTSLSDVANAYWNDTPTDTIFTVTQALTATSNTRGVDMTDPINGDKMWVLGGGFGGPYADVQIYDPGTDTWTAGPAMTQARRNFAADANNDHIWVAGGYDAGGNPLAAAEVYNPSAPCASPTPAPTNTPAPTTTPTDCPNVFVDITGNIFYVAIHYLNCRGVVNGLDATHYGPAGTSTRGQFAKVVVLGFGTPLYTPTTPDFVDVSPSYFAYTFIESGYHAGILSGFDPATCAAHGLGNPCYLPNLPITRGQLTKLVVNAGGYTLITPTGGVPDFVDVPPSNVFFVSIETAYHNGIVNGYPGHLFLPNANIRRDEMAQIVYEGIINRPH